MNAHEQRHTMKPVVMIFDDYTGFLARLRDALTPIASDLYEIVTASASFFRRQNNLGSQTGASVPDGSHDTDGTAQDQGRLCPSGRTSGAACTDRTDSSEIISRDAEKGLPFRVFAVILPAAVDDGCFYRFYPHLRRQKDKITILHWSGKAGQNDSGAALSRYSGADAVHRKLCSILLEPAAAQDTAETPSGRTGTVLAFSEAFARRTARYIAQKTLSEGHALLYVPLMPLYRMSEPFQHGPGKTLGDLITAIASSAPPDTGTLGSWLYWHEHGYYTFRLPERADDLVSCEKETLRRITLLLSRYARTRKDKMTVWIDARELFLEKRLAVASLCDFVYVETPSEYASPAAAIARRELGIFLAGLPGSCDILELPSAKRSPGKER